MVSYNIGVCGLTVFYNIGVCDRWCLIIQVFVTWILCIAVCSVFCSEWFSDVVLFDFGCL